MFQGKHDFRARGPLRSPTAGAHGQFPFPGAGEAASYGDLLDPNQFEGVYFAIAAFKAELNYLADPLHQSVEILCLSVTAVQRRSDFSERPFSNLILAVTYVPTQLPVQYHRPYEA